MTASRPIVAERELRGLEVVLAQLGDSMGPDLIVGRIEGALQFEALREACFRVQQRHPSLRAAIVWPGGDRPQRARLRAHAPDRQALDVEQIEGAAVPWQAAAQQQSRHRFDLQRGFLFRVVWVREPGAAGGHLIVCSHHAIVDGTSLMRLLHQILEATVAVQQELERGAASAEAAAARLPAVMALPLPASIHSHLRFGPVARALAWLGRHLAVRDQRRFTRAPWLPLAPAAMQPRSRHDIATLCACASGDSARWAVLSAVCKERGATVGGAFAAAVQFAVCRHLAAHGRPPPMAGRRVCVPLSMDFNMRIRIDRGTIDAQAIGLGTSIANVGVPVDADIDFWSLARLLTRSARRQLRLGTPKLFQAVTDTVVDFHGLWRRRGVEHGRTGGAGDGVNISNVGRYPFPHEVGPLRLRDVHGFNGACVGGPMFIFWLRHVDAHLCYNAIAAHPAVDRAALDAVFADVVDLMERLAPAAAAHGLTLAAHAKVPIAPGTAGTAGPQEVPA